MDRPLTQSALLALLLTWLGASGPAFLFALWETGGAALDVWAVHRRRRPRSVVWQAWVNLALAGTFLFQGVVYLGLGVLVVLGPAHISLTGPGSVVVLVPPLVLIFQVAVLRFNRVRQDRLLTAQIEKREV